MADLGFEPRTSGSKFHTQSFTVLWYLTCHGVFVVLLVTSPDLFGILFMVSLSLSLGFFSCPIVVIGPLFDLDNTMPSMNRQDIYGQF